MITVALNLVELNFPSSIIAIVLSFSIYTLNGQEYSENDLKYLNQKVDSISNESVYKKQFFRLTDQDSISLNPPIEYRFEFILEDLIGLETNKLDFIIKSQIIAYHDFQDTYILKSGDTITLDPEYFNAFNFVYPENENLYRGEWTYNGTYDSIAQYSRYFESEMYHNWDLRKYPFDVQELEFRIEALQDTSLIRLNYSKEFPPFYRNIYSLKRGFKIDTIIFEERFDNSSMFNIDLDREEIYSTGIFKILVSRDKSGLFLKLFSGGILSLILAWIALFIPVTKDESRIELSIGSVFAAVGNKYFVDSSMGSEILTTADLFNNLVILFVVLNAGYLVWQMRRKDKEDIISPLWMLIIFIMSFSIISYFISV